ncbi:MAG: M56 family metallopeptidase [Candidatus Aminicenantes bacterium]|nr:M56 family metallopeptidase [Candidatus Aminicenantes bacterium]
MSEFISYLLQSSVYLGVFYLFHQLWLRNDTFFRLNRYYLLLSAAASLLLPLLKVTSPFRTVTATFPVGDFYAAALPPRPFSVEDGLLILYLGGVFFFTARFTFRLIQLIRLNARSEKLRINGVRIVLLDGICSTFSFFRTIYICRSNYNFKGMDDVIAHELVHIRQGHSLDVLLSEILSIFQWFNPFVWPYKRVLKENHEYLADKGVLNRGCSLVAYQLLIVEQHVGGKLLEFASSFKNSQIKRRITMMGKKESGRLSRWKPAFIFPLAVVLILALGQPKILTADESATAVMASLEVGGYSLSASQEDPKKEEELKKKKELELKEKQLALKNKLAELEKMLKAEQDPEKKQKLKQMYVDLRNKMEQAQANGNGNGSNPYLQKMELVKQKINETENLEEKAKLKQMYLELKEKYEAEILAKEKALKEKQIKEEEKKKK